MRTITEGRVLAVFASTPGHFLGLGDGHLLRAKFSSFMTAVAEWLLGRFAATAPPVVTWFHIHDDGLFAWDLGFGHICGAYEELSEREALRSLESKDSASALPLENCLPDQKISLIVPYNFDNFSGCANKLRTERCLWA